MTHYIFEDFFNRRERRENTAQRAQRTTPLFGVNGGHHVFDGLFNLSRINRHKLTPNLITLFFSGDKVIRLKRTKISYILY